MALDRAIIKADSASKNTFDYKAKELSRNTSDMAQDFVALDAFKSTDFKISDLIAEQAGISKLESEAQQDRVNAQVLERLKSVEEKAYKEGHQLGMIDGAERAFNETKQDLLTHMKQMEGILKSVEDLKARILADNEAELVRLMYLIAKKLALRDLEENRGAVWEILRSVVGEIQVDERVVVSLNPADLTFLESLQEKSGQKIENLERIRFVTNDQIKPGGCMIESEYGTVNATVEERVDRVWQTLIGRIPRTADSKGKPE